MTDNPTTPGHPQHVVSIDQGLALKAAAERLESEFGDTFDAETIDRFLYAAHAHFAHHVSVPNFLPLLADALHSNSFARWRGSRASTMTGSPPCCSCAPTTPAAHKWPRPFSPNSQARTRLRGRAVRTPAIR